MKAMILAAGLGTRLKPLTDKIPKALVEVAGVPMLERVITTLKSQGFDRLVVNVHHLGNQIIDFLNTHDFGVKIMVSDEREKLLDTGGGIVKAIPFLFGNDREPVLVHNVDILSNAKLKEVMTSHTTLLVSERDSSRKLIFDGEMDLKGWHNLGTGEYKPAGIDVQKGWNEYAFSGIYSISIETAMEMQNMFGVEKFAVMDYFLAPDRGEKILGKSDPGLKLIDIGKPSTLKGANDFLFINS